MGNMIFRKAEISELDRLYEISKSASKVLGERHVDQWQGDEAPRREEFRELILNGDGYVLTDEESEIIGFAAIIEGPDESYAVIDGKWLTEAPYCAVHKVMTDPAFRGKGFSKELFKNVFEVAKKKGYSSVRIDTHKDNLVMQKALRKVGFTYCGTIFLENIRKYRNAYEINIQERKSGGESMELQLAFDGVEREAAVKLAAEVYDLVDIIEIGTPFAYKYGMDALREIKKAAPGVRILADFKIMDGGYGMTQMAYDAGADICTVSARTWDDTVKEAIKCARDNNKQVLVDLMGTPDDEIIERAKEVDSWAPDYIYIHRAVSIKTATSPEELLRKVKGSIKNAKLGVAGGITLETLPEVIKGEPDLVIIGSAITKSPDPRGTIIKMREYIK
ncbi:MAG: GNAT family N-acetyltransferase [Clostridia bacterium]|nr:GNAT family N-acetyltransferase [Clostridia bacterium]